MLKNASTIGVVLMTTMIVYRACTIDHSIDLRSNYQRQADYLFLGENLIRLDSYTKRNIEKIPIMENIKPTVRAFNNRESKLTFHPYNTLNQQQDNSLQTTDIEQIDDFKPNESIVNKTNQWSANLEGEETLKNGLLLIYPRQHILQHPRIRSKR